MSKLYSTLRSSIKTILLFLTSYFIVNWSRSKKPLKSQLIQTEEFVVDTILWELRPEGLPVTLHLQVPERIYKLLQKSSGNYTWQMKTTGSFSVILVEQMD